MKIKLIPSSYYKVTPVFSDLDMVFDENKFDWYNDRITSKIVEGLAQLMVYFDWKTHSSVTRVYGHIHEGPTREVHEYFLPNPKEADMEALSNMPFGILLGSFSAYAPVGSMEDFATQLKGYNPTHLSVLLNRDDVMAKLNRNLRDALTSGILEMPNIVHVQNVR